MEAERPAADLTMQRSSRDASLVPARMAAWLATQLPPGAAPDVTLHHGADANGMSSETLVLDVAWTNGERTLSRYVARVAPATEDFPVFPTYDLPLQYRLLQRLAARTGVPVPQVRHLEPTGDVLGTPFFLMDRIDGDIPPDVLPYNFGDSWVSHGSPEQQRTLQDSTVATIAELHKVPAEEMPDLDPAAHGHAGDTLLARNVAKVRHWYEFATGDAGRSELVERGLAWLEAHLPEVDDADAVVCWGDSRIGNVIYRDFEPVAVLDWEMATLGPRALDVAWLSFAHSVFESITEMLEMPGMPEFLRPEDLAATYRELTGVDVGDLTWYRVFAGIQWCIVFMRTGVRQIHFGEIERPEKVEDLFHCGPLVARLLEEVGA